MGRHCLPSEVVQELRRRLEALRRRPDAGAAEGPDLEEQSTRGLVEDGSGNPLLRHDHRLTSCFPEATITEPDCDDCQLAHVGQSSVLPR